MNHAEILRVDGLARLHFTYKADPLNHDNWRSFAGEVLGGRPWAGDCDDLSSTVLDLLGRAGVPLEQRFRLWVASQRDGKIDHMAACVRDDDGQFWIVGDTLGEAYPAPYAGGDVICYQRMDEWRARGFPIIRDGAPFA